MHRGVGMEKLISVLLSYYTSKVVTDLNWDTEKNFFYPSWCPQPVAMDCFVLTCRALLIKRDYMAVSHYTYT